MVFINTISTPHDFGKTFFYFQKSKFSLLHSNKGCTMNMIRNQKMITLQSILQAQHHFTKYSFYTYFS